MKEKNPITSAILLLILGTALLSSGVYFCLQPELYRATCQIQPSRNIVPALGDSNGAYDPYFIQTEFEVIQSEVILDKVITALDLNTAWAQKSGHSEKFKTTQSRRILRNRMELRPVQNTNLIDLSIYSDDKAEAATIANALAEAYRDHRQAQNKERTLAAIKRQEAQLEEVREKIKRLEAALTPVAREPEPPVAVAVAAPAIHHEQPQPEIESEYLKQAKLMGELSALTTEELRQAIPVIAPDETLSRLQQERTSAENQLIALGQNLDETDPDLQRATQAVATLDTEIDTRIQGILQGMQARVNALKAEAENAAVKIEETREVTTNLPGEKRVVETPQNVRLSYELRELQHTRDVLELGLSKLPVAKSPQVEIIERAEPPVHPVFPNHAVGISLLIAAIITDGAGLRLLKRHLRRKI